MNKKRRIRLASQKDKEAAAERAALMQTKKGRKKLGAIGADFIGLDHYGAFDGGIGGEAEESADEDLKELLDAAGRDPLRGMDDDMLEEELECLRDGILGAAGGMSALRKESEERQRTERKKKRREASTLQLTALAKDMARLVLSSLSSSSSSSLGPSTHPRSQGDPNAATAIQLDPDSETARHDHETQRTNDHIAATRVAACKPPSTMRLDYEPGASRGCRAQEGVPTCAAHERPSHHAARCMEVEAGSARQALRIERLAQAFGLGVVMASASPARGEGGVMRVEVREGCFVPPPREVDRLLVALGDAAASESRPSLALPWSESALDSTCLKP